MKSEAMKQIKRHCRGIPIGLVDYHSLRSTFGQYTQETGTHCLKTTIHSIKFHPLIICTCIDNQRLCYSRLSVNFLHCGFQN